MNRSSCVASILFGLSLSLSATAGTLQSNLDAGESLRAAVVDTHSSGELNVESVLEAMTNNSSAAALLFLYSVESDPSLLPSLLSLHQSNHQIAIIDAYLVAAKHDLPVLVPMLEGVAVISPELAGDILYAITDVFPESARDAFEVLAAANPEEIDVFEGSYTSALSTTGTTADDSGETYEAVEPERDVSPTGRA